MEQVLLLGPALKGPEVEMSLTSNQILSQLTKFQKSKASKYQDISTKNLCLKKSIKGFFFLHDQRIPHIIF